MINKEDSITILIDHFKGVNSMKVVLHNFTELIGENQTMKSTVLDAWLWCLTGFNSNGDKNKDIRHYTKTEGDPCVTIILPKIAFRRTFQKNKNGNVTLYEVSLDQKVGFGKINLSDSNIKGEFTKGFNSHVQETFPMIRLCSDIFYFAQNMDNLEARNIVLEYGVQPSKEEVYEKLTPETVQLLVELFENYTPNAAMRIFKKKLSAIEEKKKETRAGIRSRNKDIKQLKPKSSLKRLEKQKIEIEKVLNRSQKQLEKIDSNSDLREAIQAAKDRKQEAERSVEIENDKNQSDYKSRCDLINEQYQDKITEEDERYFEAKRAADNNLKDLRAKLDLEDEIDVLKNEKEKLSEKLVKEKEDLFPGSAFERIVFVPDEFIKSDSCYACGTKLSEQRLMDVKKEFDTKQELNRKKHTEQENQRLKMFQEQQDAARSIFDDMKNKIISDINKQIEKIDKDLDEMPDFIKISADIEEIENDYPVKKVIVKDDLPDKPEKIQFDSTRYDADILKAEKDLEEVQNKNNVKERQKPILEKMQINRELQDETLEHLGKYKSIDQLEKNQIKDRNKIIELQGKADKLKIKIDAITDYNHALTDIVREKTREIFGAEIGLFREQVNGEMKEDFIVYCDTKEGPVPFRSANTGSKIKTGIKIVEKMQKIFKSFPPVFIDNAENVTEDWKDSNLNLVFMTAYKSVKRMKVKHYDTIEQLNLERKLRAEKGINRAVA